MTELLKYSSNDSEFADFGLWLEHFLTSEKFYKFANELIEIDTKLLTESVGKNRTALVNRRYKLLEGK